MNKKIFGTAVCAATLVAGAGAFAGDETMSDNAAAQLAGFERTGDVQSCLLLRTIRRMMALDERYLFIELRSGEHYLNRMTSRCNDAHRSGYYLQYETTVAKLCRNESISVIDHTSGDTVGACTLGDFERLESKTSVDN